MDNSDHVTLPPLLQVAAKCFIVAKAARKKYRKETDTFVVGLSQMVSLDTVYTSVSFHKQSRKGRLKPGWIRPGGRGRNQRKGSNSRGHLGLFFQTSEA